MSDVVERVARAIRAVRSPEATQDQAASSFEAELARAAIRAILETVEQRPTDDEAGRRLLYELEAAIKETTP